MGDLKINFIYKFTEDPYGGGNQFLRALKKSFEKRGIYENKPSKANCFLFNSHQEIGEVVRTKLRNQDKVFIHRIDGPTYLTKWGQPKLDFRIYELNKYVADGTIFQSIWSKKENYSHSFLNTSFVKIIYNAPNNRVFYPLKKSFSKDLEKDKCQIVATSWSTNLNKGFELYKYLDENLNFNIYSMKFIGNSPFVFKNIKHIKPVKTNKMGDLLRECDIYTTGAIYEACSNSLLEALHCGLPCVAINNASNPELIKKGGELFDSFEECIKKLEIVRLNYLSYRDNISVYSIEQIADKYFKFIHNIYSLSRAGKYKPKSLRILDYYSILLRNYFKKISKFKEILLIEIKRIAFYLKRRNSDKKDS